MVATLSDEHVLDVCKPGTTECCRYLCMGAGGWACAKHTSLMETIDSRVAAGTMRAVGDNCEGHPYDRETPLMYKRGDTVAYFSRNQIVHEEIAWVDDGYYGLMNDDKVLFKDVIGLVNPDGTRTLSEDHAASVRERLFEAARDAHVLDQWLFTPDLVTVCSSCGRRVGPPCAEGSRCEYYREPK